MLESDIQKQIVKYLNLMNIYFFSVPNEAVNSVKRMANLKKMGLRSGVSDLIILLPNRVLFIEVKQPKKYQTKNQKEFEKNVNNLDFEYYIVHSVEELENIIKK